MLSAQTLSTRVLRQGPCRQRLVCLGVAFLLGGCAAPMTVPVALAQPGVYQSNPAEAQADADDPPGRVGRLAEVQGTVWSYQPESDEWVAAQRNRPLTTGDRLSTDSGGRAELRIGSTTVRLDGASELELLRIDDNTMALQLRSGSAAFRVRNREVLDEFELLTPEGRFTPRQPGRYRVDLRNDASHLTVWNGQALYEGDGSALTVEAGQRAEFWLDSQGAAQYSITNPLSDGFAAWNNERDRAADRSAVARYVSPEMTGVDDLDRYGRWGQDTEYGPIWTPNEVPNGWAPYSNGSWAWVAPWGWTWVDEAPWGFAPFHYGRWVWQGSRWGWAPGAYVARPVYAPALVAWVGGGNLSLGLNFGGGPGVGWFPLAPREVYVPWYRVGPRYVRNVNHGHVNRIDNLPQIIRDPQGVVGRTDYRNRRYPHGVTLVPEATFASRRPVGPDAARWRDWADRQARNGQQFLPSDPARAQAGIGRPAGWDRPRGDGRPSGRPENPGRPQAQFPNNPAGNSVVRPTRPNPERVPDGVRQSEGRRPWESGVRPVQPDAARPQNPVLTSPRNNTDSNNNGRPDRFEQQGRPDRTERMERPDTERPANRRDSPDIRDNRMDNPAGAQRQPWRNEGRGEMNNPSPRGNEGRAAPPVMAPPAAPPAQRMAPPPMPSRPEPAAREMPRPQAPAPQAAPQPPQPRGDPGGLNRSDPRRPQQAP